MRVIGAFLLTLPLLVLPAVAGLLWAHDATWSIWVGLVVGLFGLLAAVAAVGTGGRGALLPAAGVVLVAIGVAAAVSGLWMTLVGRDATATVSAVHVESRGRGGLHQSALTLRLADGGTVPGELYTDYVGAPDVGDRLRVRYDPTGVIRLPQYADSGKNLQDAVGGPVGVLAGIALLVTPRLRRGPATSTNATGPAATADEKLSVGELAQRLAAERGDSTPPAR